MLMYIGDCWFPYMNSSSYKLFRNQQNEQQVWINTWYVHGWVDGERRACLQDVQHKVTWARYPFEAIRRSVCCLPTMKRWREGRCRKTNKYLGYVISDTHSWLWAILTQWLQYSKFSDVQNYRNSVLFKGMNNWFAVWIHGGAVKPSEADPSSIFKIGHSDQSPAAGSSTGNYKRWSYECRFNSCSSTETNWNKKKKTVSCSYKCSGLNPMARDCLDHHQK